MKERSHTVQVAPLTSMHILKLAQLGAYDTNEFFRVDKGFVAQVQSCEHGRQVPLNREQLVRYLSNRCKKKNNRNLDVLLTFLSISSAIGP